MEGLFYNVNGGYVSRFIPPVRLCVLTRKATWKALFVAIAILYSPDKTMGT